MERSRWVKPKSWKYVCKGAVVRVKWPYEKYRYGMVINAMHNSCLVELDTGGSLTLDNIKSFDMKELYEDGSVYFTGEK